MPEWFIHANGERQGPLQAAEILAMVRDMEWGHSL